MNKKFIAKLLALAMVLAMVPATFLAANASASEGGRDANDVYTEEPGDTNAPEGGESQEPEVPGESQDPSDPSQTPGEGEDDSDPSDDETDDGETSGGNDIYNSTSKDTSVNVPEVVVVTPVAAEDIVVENGTTTITAKVVNKTASVSLNEAAVQSLSDLVSNGTIELVINDEGATKLSVTVPAKAMTALAEETGADLTIKSSVATISIPNSVLTSELGTTGSVKITVQATGNNVSFSIQVAGQALNGVKGITVSF